MERDRERWAVEDYLAAVRRDDPSAPDRFWACALRLALALSRRRRLPREDAEDAVVAAYCAASEDGHAALARVRSPSTPLSRWIAGVLGHHLDGELRRLARTHAASPSDARSRAFARRAHVSEQRRTRLGRLGAARLGELTSRQRATFELYLEGLSTAGIAERLSIGRAAARERIRGVWRHLAALPRRPAPAQITRLLGPGGPSMSSVERETLASLAKGRSHREVALLRGESRDAVRSRVQRVRRRDRKRP